MRIAIIGCIVVVLTILGFGVPLYCEHRREQERQHLDHVEIPRMAELQKKEIAGERLSDTEKEELRQLRERIVKRRIEDRGK